LLRHSAFPVVDDDGQTVGLVTVKRVNRVPADERDRTTLAEVACPLAEVARATPDEPVADVLPRLNGCSDGRALVFDDGRLAGIVAPADIIRALEHPGLTAAAESGQGGEDDQAARGL
jgi:CBS domain-containing protein